MTSPNINSHSFYDAPVASLAFVDTRFTQEPSGKLSWSRGLPGGSGLGSRLCYRIHLTYTSPDRDMGS